MPIYLKVPFSIWPQTAILNFDGWNGQNTKTMPEMDFPQISRKSGITQLSIAICFQVTFQYGHRRPFLFLASHKFRRHFREDHGG